MSVSLRLFRSPLSSSPSFFCRCGAILTKRQLVASPVWLPTEQPGFVKGRGRRASSLLLGDAKKCDTATLQVSFAWRIKNFSGADGRRARNFFRREKKFSTARGFAHASHRDLFGKPRGGVMARLLPSRTALETFRAATNKCFTLDRRARTRSAVPGIQL